MTLSRRALLTGAAGTFGALTAGCTLWPAHDRVDHVVPAAGQGSAADDITGPYDRRRADGAAIHALFINNTYSKVLREDLPAFTALTGIEVRTTLLPEEEYFDRVTTALVSGLPDVDVFMTGAYMVWQYGPPGWMEDLDPWLANPSTTAEDYDVDDLLPHLQDALRWDFTLGEPVGGGGRWALPWWWESNVLAYRADVFERLGLHPPETFAELEEVARVTDAQMKLEQPGQGYDLAVRGSLSWATVQAGFMTAFTREGGRDFTVRGGHLAPVVDSPVSVDFHRRWTAMVREAGPRRWSEYNYQNCTYDLGSGRAAMMYDATSIGLPLDAPMPRRQPAGWRGHRGRQDPTATCPRTCGFPRWRCPVAASRRWRLGCSSSGPREKLTLGSRRCATAPTRCAARCWRTGPTATPCRCTAATSRP